MAKGSYPNKKEKVTECSEFRKKRKMEWVKIKLNGIHYLNSQEFLKLYLMVEVKIVTVPLWCSMYMEEIRQLFLQRGKDLNSPKRSKVSILHSKW